MGLGPFVPEVEVRLRFPEMAPGAAAVNGPNDEPQGLCEPLRFWRIGAPGFEPGTSCSRNNHVPSAAVSPRWKHLT